MTPSILEEIVESKRREVASARIRLPFEKLEAQFAVGGPRFRLDTTLLLYATNLTARRSPTLRQSPDFHLLQPGIFGNADPFRDNRRSIGNGREQEPAAPLLLEFRRFLGEQ